MRVKKNQIKNLKKHYIVYKISNDFNNKVYIGAHKCRNGKEDDGYICSSKMMLSLILKNPKSYHKTILARFTTAREADRFETKSIKEYDSYKNGYNQTKNGGHYIANERNKKQKVFKNSVFDDIMNSRCSKKQGGK